MKHKLIGIDLAKNVFQVCAVNQAGLPILPVESATSR